MSARDVIVEWLSHELLGTVKHLRSDADRLLSILDEAGYVVAPRHVTPEMVDAYLMLSYNDEGGALDVSAEDAWNAMIAASV